MTEVIKYEVKHVSRNQYDTMTDLLDLSCKIADRARGEATLAEKLELKAISKTLATIAKSIGG